MSLDASADAPSYVVPAHVVLRAFVSETVVLNLRTGQYHGLNPSAGRMLEVLGELGDPASVAARLAEEYGVSQQVVLRDLEGLCRDLLDRGLIETHPAAEP